MFQHVEPFYGWLHLYSHDRDEHSPFHAVEHNLFEYDRHVYNFPAHPTWDHIDSESLLVKILYADYTRGFAVLEFLGEWNDLHENDFKLLRANCLDLLAAAGIVRYVFVLENVFHIYLDQPDYYEEFMDQLDGGWLVLLGARAEVQQDVVEYGLSDYFFWSAALDALNWRKMNPWHLLERIELVMSRLLV